MRGAATGAVEGAWQGTKDLGSSLWGFGKGVGGAGWGLAKGTAAVAIKGVDLTVKLNSGNPNKMLEAASEAYSMGKAAVGHVKESAALLSQGVQHPEEVINAMAEIGIEKSGESVGGATFETALLVAPVAKGAPIAAVASEGRRAAVMAAIQESRAARASSGFGEFAEGGAVKAAEAARAAGSSYRRELFQAIGAQGARLETTGKAAVTSAGETVIESQYLQGAVQKGFDFLSFKGAGEGAQLLLNEAKAVSGAVPAQKFTTFGLGASGQRTFESAMRVARARIENAGLDVLTREALLGQLETGGARIRLIGGRGTQFTREAITSIEEATGLKVTSTVNLTRPR
jgi:hypothetical protein